jgi:enoyl-[acyl-carrier protein] reductase III
MGAETRGLEGRVALITGGSRGLGAATARRLAHQGVKVILTYRERQAEAETVAEECSSLTPGAWCLPMDLIDEDSVSAAFERVKALEPRLDYLIANAAATALKPLLEVKMHQIDKTFAISVRHFILMAQLAFPLLEKSHGRLIGVSGADVVGYIPSHGLLAAAKAAMETVIRYLACELGPMGVTAMGVLPGFIDTESIEMMTGPFYERIKQAEVETHPLRAAATPDDAAEVIALLCQDEARWLNGQVVSNDGAGLFAMIGRNYHHLAGAGNDPSVAPIIGV